MLEMKIKIEAADTLISAIDRLAAALEKNNFSVTVPEGSTLNMDFSKHSASVNPTPAPVAAPAPAPVAPTLPTASITPAAASVQMSAATTAPIPAVPVAAAPTYTIDQIAKAGASLVDAGKMEQLLALLARYGVAAVTQLQPDQFGAFATELRSLGARI